MNSEKERLQEDYFDLSNIYVLLYKYKLHLFIVLVISGLVSALVSLSIQEKYKSVAIIYPASTSSAAKALVGAGWGGNYDIMKFGENEKSEQLLEVLNSANLKNIIINQFNLMDHYDLSTESASPKYDLNEIIETNISFKRNKNMAIEIKVLDHSPDTAAKIAKALLVALDEVIYSIKNERAMQGLNIVKNSYLALSKEIKEMEDSLSFIMGKGVLHVQSQSEVYGDAYARAISQGDKRAEEALKLQLDLLSKYGAQSISLSNSLGNEKHRLSVLKGKYEESKIDAESRLQNYFVITAPFAAEKKSYPVRWLIIVMGVLGALFTGVATIALYEKFQKIKIKI
jgi:capsule polysaccharide export protein KpsE/RkpR|tara:strand:+ start:1574 stop:2599 length:1026 start_codon:yes stop_codon:yes gene_type:complete